MMRPAVFAGLAAAGLGITLLFFGCDGASSSRRKASGPGVANGSTAALPAARCEEFLGQAYDMLQPDRLGISAEREVAVGVLNQWLLGCADRVEVARPSADAEEEVKALISPAAWERMHESHFALRDAGHIRNALLFRKTNEFVLAGAANDLERAVRLFNYVARTVALERPEERLPLTPYEILVFGRGSAEDRAWIFAELLRQLRIDAVILRPQDHESEGEMDGDWLVGVLLDDQVYLFDPVRGTAVPSAIAPSESTVPVATPATLAEVTTNEEQYPLEAQAYQSPRVEVVGYSSYWSERMHLLQQSLAGERSVVVYDPLAESAEEPGLLARVAEFGQDRWQPSDMGVWSYPETQLAAFEQMDQQMSARLQARWAPFSSPVPVTDVTGSGEVRLAPPRHEQLKARLRQLQGDFSTAIGQYLAIRMAERKVPTAEDAYIPSEAQAHVLSRLPAEVQRLHREAAEDALFWTGVAQLEMGDHESALRSFGDYVGRYRQREWTDHARKLVATILVRMGEPRSALQVVEQVDPSSPQAAELKFIRNGLSPAAPGE